VRWLFGAPAHAGRERGNKNVYDECILKGVHALFKSNRAPGYLPICVRMRPKARSSRSNPPLVRFAVRLNEASKHKLIAFAMAAQTCQSMCIERGCEDAPHERLEIMCDPLSGLAHSAQPSRHEFVSKHFGLCVAVSKIIRLLITQVRARLGGGGVLNMDKKLCYASMMLIKANAQSQRVHCDNGYTGKCGYYTAIVPLTTHDNQGDTEFVVEGQDAYQTYRGAKAFRGDLLHRGGANRSQRERIALALVFADAPDPNRIGRQYVASWH